MSEPIRPPTAGITVEAAEHLSQNGYPVTDSEADEVNDNGVSSPFVNMADAFARPAEDMSEGEVIDAEIVDEGLGAESDAAPPSTKARRGRTRNQQQPREPREAKTGPPSLDEWTGFFGRVVLRVATEYYISFAFRGIDEELLTEHELDRLAMSDDERQLIAVPLAEISNKSKFMRKHGRMIVASGDAFNAMVVFGMWMARVNRIAAKYRPKQPKVVGGHLNGSSGQGSAQASGTQEGSSGGRFPPGFYGPIIPGSG